MSLITFGIKSFANSLDAESNRNETLMIQDESTVKYESRFLHASIYALEIEILWEKDRHKVLKHKI